jgi:ankyrin repeat protein
LLNDKRINPNIVDKEGRNALLEAAAAGCDKCIELLLNIPNIELNVIDSYGATALTRAIGNADFECTLMLARDRRVDLNIVDKHGNNMLMLAIQCFRFYDRANDNYAEDKSKIIEVMLSNEKLNINQVNEFGKTALSLAQERGYTDIVEKILKKQKN